MTTCQAQAMDRDVMGEHHDPAEVPPCDGPRDTQRRGWWLCIGCAEALDWLAVLDAGEVIPLTEEQLATFAAAPLVHGE
jgi:hypothetical protein